MQAKTLEEIIPFFREAAEYKIMPIVIAMGQIKGEGAIDDFQSLVLKPHGEDEAQRYLEAEEGEALNLSPEEIALFQDLNQNVQQGCADRIEKPMKESFEGKHIFTVKRIWHRGCSGPFRMDNSLTFPA